MKPLIAANWKMHKTVAEAEAFCRQIRQMEGQFSGVEVLICPPYTALAAVQKALQGSTIKLGAQNMFWAERGAFTGEIAPSMLRECGVEYVILGHSERRHIFGEDDSLIRKKLAAALSHGLKPILCVGETEEEREEAATERVLEQQLCAALEGLDQGKPGEIVIAYEPVWAIGTGKAAVPADAENAAAWIRQVAARYLPEEDMKALRIQYGGSVTVDNIAEFMALPTIQGALVGGASLEAATFGRLALAAGEAVNR